MSQKDKKHQQLFDAALDLYFADQFSAALVLFNDLLLQQLSTPIKAETIRRKADCLTMLGRAEEALPLYDEALELTSDTATQMRWILASKGWCLFKLQRHQEALEFYKQAICLIDDKEDLDHLKQQTDSILDDYEYIQANSDLELEKENLTSFLDEKISLIQEDEEDKLFEGRPILRA